ncbi:MAG: hypothetical protein WBL19_02795 [Minisyncoccia bacterium]
MSRFKSSPEFEKELKRLKEKYKSLDGDLRNLEDILSVRPTGGGKNFKIIHHSEKFKIVKVRLACRSLHKRSLRVIYAHHVEEVTFLYIEIYNKGDKENENHERIKDYIKLQNAPV